MNVFISELAFSIGELTNTVEEAAAEGLLVSDPEMLRQSGFSKHHRCAPQTSAYDLARQAVESIRDRLGDIGGIIYSSCIPSNGNVGSEHAFHQTRDVKHLMDFPASHLQKDFPLDRASIIGLSQQACTGMLGSFRLARNLLIAEPEVKRVLCVSSDRFPAGSLYEQSYNLISDGATACVVSSNAEGFRFVACHAVTNGAMSQATDDETVGSFFNYSHLTIQQTLQKADLKPSDIDMIVAQNMNPAAWQILSRLLQIDFERVHFPTQAEIGHVISGDNIINLKYLDDRGVVKSGYRVLLFMAGYGLNWQCVILEKL